MLHCRKSLVDASRASCSHAMMTSQRRAFSIHQWRAFQRWQDLERDQKVYEKEKWLLKNTVKFGQGIYLTPERVEQIRPPKEVEDMTRRETGAMSIEYHTMHTMMRYIDHSFDNIRRCREYKHFQHLQYDQRFLPDRLMYLGADLAAAYFIVHRNGAVKFVGNDTWAKRDQYLRYKLPGHKVEGLYIEAIDASNTELMYEGFDNLYDLHHIRMLSLSNCARINDWTLSRVGAIFSESLELLDLSHCKRISAKGLLGLRSLSKLKFLRLEGFDKVPDIAKSALLLEEAIPGLTVVGLDFDAALKRLGEEIKLLEDDRILLDAKGNAFAEDDDGRLFYVKGNVNERPAVCDDDKPLVTSTIRREIPNMDDEEFERLDNLSKGKLRHLLVGSPSGYSWNEDVETILSSEWRWKEMEHKPLDTKMLPSFKRLPILEERKRLEEQKLEMLEAEMEGDDGEVPSSQKKAVEGN